MLACTHQENEVCNSVGQLLCSKPIPEVADNHCAQSVIVARQELFCLNEKSTHFFAHVISQSHVLLQMHYCHPLGWSVECSTPYVKITHYRTPP